METRAWFGLAADSFLSVLPATQGRLEHAALGDWTVRSLLGHTTRAFTTLESYLSEDAPACPEPALTSPAAYYRAARGGLADPAAVTERGVQAGLDLGDDPQTAVHEVVRRVLGIVAAARDDSLVRTPLGSMRLDGYLPTRACEISIHTLDLARATGHPVPGALAETLPDCLGLLAAAAGPAQREQLVLAATGRESLPESFSLL